MRLQIAHHSEPDAYWAGPDYELNMTFEVLRDRQWQRLTQSLWDDPTLDGPFEARYVPGSGQPTRIPVQAPAPTATQTHYGLLSLEGMAVGCRLLLTRSLFECATLQVPLSMFEGSFEEEPLLVPSLDYVLQEIALAIFAVAPFELANIGSETGCYLVAELLADPQQRDEFVTQGNFFARDSVLAMLDVSPTEHVEARPGLRWVSA